MSDEIRQNGLDSASSDFVDGNGEKIEFEFVVGMPKTALVFEEGDDEEALEEAVDVSVAQTVTAPQQSFEEPHVSSETEETEPQRTENDEEFNLPDMFALNGEATVPFDQDREPMIWKTYVPGFTEASEKRYKLVDEEEMRHRDSIKRAKIARAAGMSYAKIASSAKPAESPVEKEEKIVCPVCGHANSEYAALCKMCSNYLRG